LDAPGGGRLFPDALRTASAKKAALAIAECALSLKADGREPMELICTGALTNAALLVEEQLVRITLMGGAMGVGNTGPVQEFNIQTDPEAAHIVLESGLPVTMVPIEVRLNAVLPSRQPVVANVSLREKVVNSSLVLMNRGRMSADVVGPSGDTHRACDCRCCKPS
jgi:inosine-uridine nucleoside N-ribohydrolase